VNAEELIAAIVAAPDDDEPWLVYTDWLLDRGDPRGELMSLQAAVDAEDPAAIWRLRELENDEDRLLSPRLLAQTRYWRFEWKRGFIGVAELRAEAGPPTRECLEALFAEPHAALIDSLTLDALKLAPEHDRHRRLELGDCNDGLARMSRLATLTLNDVVLTSLSHERMTRLSSTPLACPALSTGDFSLPSLVDLHLRAALPDLDQPRSILRRPPSTLTTLSLEGATAQTIAQLAELEVARQLTALFVDAGTFAAIAALRDHAARFESIQTVGFGYIDDQADETAVAALRADLDRLLPGRTIYASWENFAPQEPFVEAYEPLPEHRVDEQSRRPDGQIDAIGAWVQRAPKP